MKFSWLSQKNGSILLSITMVVNGQSVAADSGMTLLDLIRKYELDPATVAVERNGEIPDRAGWETLLLEEGDRIELIRFVGGG